MDLYVKYETAGYVAKINISFHNLQYFVVDFVWLTLTNYQDAILVFFTKLQPHAGTIWKGIACKCFANTLPWWWFCWSKFFLYLFKSHGSTSKWRVSCSEDIWSSLGINTAFFPWSETRLSKGSNSLLQFLCWRNLSDFTSYRCKMKYTHNKPNISN